MNKPFAVIAKFVFIWMILTWFTHETVVPIVKAGLEVSGDQLLVFGFMLVYMTIAYILTHRCSTLVYLMEDRPCVDVRKSLIRTMSVDVIVQVLFIVTAWYLLPSTPVEVLLLTCGLLIVYVSVLYINIRRMDKARVSLQGDVK